MMLGRNSSTRLPPMSEAREVAQVSPTTLPVLLGRGIVAQHGERRRAARPADARNS